MHWTFLDEMDGAIPAKWRDGRENCVPEQAVWGEAWELRLGGGVLRVPGVGCACEYSSLIGVGFFGSSQVVVGCEARMLMLICGT